MTKTCAYCKNSFESNSKFTKYCSNKCRNQAKKKPKTCENCGSIFMSKNKHARFCSIKCSQIYRYRENHVTLTCDYCGKQFDRIKSKVRSDYNYCSDKCFRKAPKPYMRNSILVSCANCGKTFWRQRYLIKDVYNYCSHDCYAKHSAIIGRFRGENNPHYNSQLTQEERERGRSYQEYYAWREKVYERDNYTCQCCGRKGVELNAHHIFNYSTHKELRTDLANGITLCKDCHDLFHQIYGRFNNNDKQINEFIARYANTEPSLTGNGGKV